MRVRLLGVPLAVLALLLAAGATASGARVADRPFRVGVVLEPSAWGADGLVGFRRAVRELGIEQPKVLRPSPKEGYLAAFRYLGRQGYDLAVGVGIQTADGAVRASLAFPGTRFAMIDTPVEVLKSFKIRTPPNLEGVTFAVQEASYLAGFLGALTEQRRPGRDVVSAVGGARGPWVDGFIAGFEAGARRASPRIATLHGYAGFGDPAECRNVALQQIARGSGVIFPVAGACGLGALEAAKDRGVWGIGVDVDRSSLGPHVLTSVLKRFDVAVYETIHLAKRGGFRGGRTLELGLREGGVGLGKISPRVPRAFVARVERLRRQIVAGAIGRIPSTLGPATP